MIFQISENKTAKRIYMSKDISEEDYLKKYNINNDLISYPTELVPNVSFLKYIDGKIVEDLETIKEFEFSVKKNESIELLRKTDFLMLSDNPKNLSNEELETVIKYRKDLRDYNNLTDIYPTIPDFLIKII